VRLPLWRAGDFVEKPARVPLPAQPAGGSQFRFQVVDKPLAASRALGDGRGDERYARAAKDRDPSPNVAESFFATLLSNSIYLGFEATGARYRGLRFAAARAKSRITRPHVVLTN
jgi:hypothetical protein